MFSTPASLVRSTRCALLAIVAALIIVAMLLGDGRLTLGPRAASAFATIAAATLFPLLLASFPFVRRDDLRSGAMLVVTAVAGIRLISGDMGGLADGVVMALVILSLHLSSGIEIMRARARKYPNELFEVIAIEEGRARRRRSEGGRAAAGVERATLAETAA